MVTVMGAAHESADVYIAQGRILELVATGEVYDGTLHDLSRDVGLPSATLRACLRELGGRADPAVRSADHPPGATYAGPETSSVSPPPS